MSLCSPCAGIDAFQLSLQSNQSEYGNRRGLVVSVDNLTKHHGTFEELVDCACLPNACSLCKLFVFEWAREEMDRSNSVEKLPTERHVSALGRVFLTSPKRDDASVKRWLQQEHSVGERTGMIYYGPSHTEKELEGGIRVGISLWLKAPGKNDVGSECMIGTAYFFFKRGMLASLSHPDTATIRAKDVVEDPGTPACLGVATQWLQDCLTTHEKCRSAIGLNPKLPKRVIDVGDEDKLPRLVETNGMSGNYSALSYCWGPDLTLTLTQRNLDSLTKGIRNMPRTLEDAVKVTRGIGLRYLWIDAICIIQDSNEDWREQAARMNDTYSDATVTIFAAYSAASAEGLLQKREAVEEVSLPWKQPSKAPGEIFVRLSQKWHGEWDDNFLAYCPWSERGWTLQERLSAGRGLTFTKKQMSWHCLTCISRENGEFVDQIAKQKNAMSQGTSDRLADISDHWAGLIRMQDVQEEGLTMGTYHDMLVAQFYRIMNDFRDRVFKYRSDQLPAVAALAKAVENRLQGRDRYWAGLWESNVAKGLLWNTWKLKPGVNYGRPPGSGGSRVVLPSWSWASVILSMFPDICTLQEPLANTGTNMNSAQNVVSGSLLKNIRFPNLDDQEERFIPTRPIELRFTAPFQQLSDDWFDPNNGVDASYPGLSAFETILRDDFYPKGQGSDGHDSLATPKLDPLYGPGSEFAQKHQPCPGQVFAAIKIYKWMEPINVGRYGMGVSHFETTAFLILESETHTGDSNATQRFRRVGRLNLTKGYSGHYPRPVMEWEGRSVYLGDVLEMLDEKPWKEKEVVLV
ncbi:heterokaryon incompatibility protein-domain-containing protein [Triangularia verruculosa]|uniref:Heterokaryon incompatibility protein-domain-containing protein n=1 Tax=Triangularia verruculosa TaxID=2587418 RepID=A0AAN6X9F2_9PEZI|nr:heterokaryon incompatibility protein-domain-containing protein [Triangularia verruculosa]